MSTTATLCDGSKVNILEVHEYSTLFPFLKGPAFDALVEDIGAHGLREPIVLYEDKILDGRNRYLACQALGMEVTTRPYDGEDPIGFVLSVNLHRRHLDASQRAMVAAKLADLGVGANQNTAGTPIGVAAKLLNVGRGSIDRARVVLKSGDAEIVKAVETGEVPVSKAADEVKQSKTSASKSKKSGGTKTSKSVTPESTKQSDDADNLVDRLIDVLKEMKPETQEALLIGMFKRFRDAGYILDLPDMAIETEDEADEEEDEKEAA
jgi:hypothetical protein